VTLQEFLARCSEFEESRDPASGLLLCEEFLATGVRGRSLAFCLRYKAVFLLRANLGWATEATVHLRQALELFKNDPVDQAPVLSTMITAYAMFGRFDMAYQYAGQFFELVEQNPDPEIRLYIPRVWFNLAYAYDAAGQYERAAEAYSQAYDEALIAPDKLNPGLAAHNLVQMLLELGRVDDALKMLQASKAHLEEGEVGSFMKNQEALYLLATGQIDDAGAACRDALAHPSCPERVRAEVLFTQARLAHALDAHQDRDRIANEALDIVIRLPHPRLSRKINMFAVAVRNREEVPES